MSGKLDVMAVLLPQAGSQDTVARVRWALSEVVGGKNQFSFPLPEDSFEVTLTKLATGDVVQQKAVFPHPYVMLDPPRTSRNLASAADAALGREFWNALPAQWPWKPVDSTLTKLSVGKYNTLAVGVAHLLGRSHPAHVEFQLRALAASGLKAGITATSAQNIQAARQDELDAWAALFAATFRQFPGHPRELQKHVRSRLRAAQSRLTLASVFPWLAAAVIQAVPTESRALAAVLQLLGDDAIGAEAERIAGEAQDIRDLMALRAAQGGEIIDYWCDYDKAATDQPSQTCPPSAQGRRVRAAEALGMGVDFILSLQDMQEALAVSVTHVRPNSFSANAQYTFPADEPSSPCAPGKFSIHSKPLRLADTQRLESNPPPPASDFSAWVDYDLVSNYAIPPSESLPKHLDDVMKLAKPVTGDGMVTLRIVRRPSEVFPYDYSFNVYCIWDGEFSGSVQKYLDDPTQQPTLEELRPFLLTRRYSFRRDIQEAFKDPTRISALNLLTRPMHEALLGLPEEITQNGTRVPYPSKDSSGGQAARLTFNLRDLMPVPGAPQGVRWERQGGGRPDEYGKAPGWTVENARPETKTLMPAVLPQRYRLWITAVDIFEQESEPVPVMGAEQGDRASPYVFTPRWRSPPPGAESLTCIYGNGQLDVGWKVAEQPLIGTASTYVRTPLDAYLVVLRRIVLDVKEVATAAPTVLSEANPVLERQVAALLDEGWEVWQTLEVAVDVTKPAQSQSFAVKTGDTGFEYTALVSHVVPASMRKFIHRDDVQTLRYLQQVGEGDQARFEEQHWSIPATGAESRYRNYPAYGPHGASQSVSVLPSASQMPALKLEGFAAELVRATPVRGVLGIDRDQVLSKIVELRDAPPPVDGLTSAHRLMMSTALERLKPQMDASNGAEMVRELLQREFGAHKAGENIAKSHPIIGMRGAIRLKWMAKRYLDAVPVVQYRVYRAVAATNEPSTYKATLNNDVLTFAGPAPSIAGSQAQMVVLSGQSGVWTGLVGSNGTAIRVYGLRSNGFSAGKQSPPPSELLNVSLVAGELVKTVPGSTGTEPQDYLVALPVGGGYREYALWWVVATDCMNKEQWLDGSGHPQVFAAALPATITPLPIATLAVTAPKDFLRDTPDPANFEAQREYLPKQLPKDGLPLFPRTILTWDAKEVAGAEEYVFIERETEREALTVASMSDPAWALLRTIQASPVGSPWGSKYEALRQWLEGGAAPSPGDDFEHQDPKFFFATSSQAAWGLKSTSMLQGKAPPSLVDYFDTPPTEPGGGLEPAFGEKRVRYRAYKLVDLTPEITQHDPSGIGTRYLVSEPSAWTAWTRQDWPPLRITHSVNAVHRDGASLVQFSVRSGYVSGIRPARTGTEDPFFFRVTLRRDVPPAFAAKQGSGARDGKLLIGQMLRVPLTPSGQTKAQVTADHSLERDAPLASRKVSYVIASELVWRQAANDERVLRMFEDPYAFSEDVPSTVNGAEARLDIALTISVGV